MPALTAMIEEPGQRDSASWIDDGEKYAVIALSVKFDDTLSLQPMTPHHWAFADTRFDMPAHWREWLGTIRTKEVEGSNLFLLSKMPSQAPEIVDAETAELKRHAGHFAGKSVRAGAQAGNACRLPPKRRNQRSVTG